MASKEVNGRFGHMGRLESTFKNGIPQPGDGKDGPADYAHAKRGGNKASKNREPLQRATPKFHDSEKDRRTLKKNNSAGDTGYIQAHA